MRKYFTFCLLIVVFFQNFLHAQMPGENCLFSDYDLLLDKPELTWTLSKTKKSTQSTVIATKQIQLSEYPGAHNPSMIKVDQGYLLTFRYLPEPFKSVSYVGVVLLNDKFELISKPELLNTRLVSNHIPSHSEDARIFSFKDKIYIIYNDNIENLNPTNQHRRDMFIAELQYEDNHFVLSPASKFIHKYEYDKVLWQKNWVPFEWNDTLFMSYSIVPHEVLTADFVTGVCEPLYKTYNSIEWKYGNKTMRGGTPAILVDGEYLAFFHSSMKAISVATQGKKLWHYFMGAYTFSSEPPFEITKMTPIPILSDDFYTYSDFEKRVIFPGGFVVDGSKIHVAYGKDDAEVWIATIDREELAKLLVPVEQHETNSESS